MIATLEELTIHLLNRVRSVRQGLGFEDELPHHPDTPFTDVLDSMGLVEFLAIVAEDCQTTPEAIEQCVDRQFGTVAELAAALHTAGQAARTRSPTSPRTESHPESATPRTELWLTATSVRLPDLVQSAETINALLQRPAGWLERRAGIRSRRIWGMQDPLSAAVAAGRESLERAGVLTEEIGALLVTSEAPPVLAGLAAALHHRLDMRPTTVALELGGACTGFLSAVWLARSLLPQVGAVLVVAVEAPSHYLSVQPGPAGEAAALFGDAATACVLCGQPRGSGSVIVNDIMLGADGGAGRMIQVEHSEAGSVQLHLEGRALANRAVGTMAQSVRELLRREGLTLAVLQAVVAHGGNGRLPALLARQLDLPLDRVWSQTERAGNLGSASLPVAWAAHAPPPPGPIVWTAVGAGLTWATAITGKVDLTTAADA